MVKVIVLCKRTDDWHACLENRPEDWECAPDATRAVAKLAKRFNLQKVSVHLNPPLCSGGTAMTWTIG